MVAVAGVRALVMFGAADTKLATSVRGAKGTVGGLRCGPPGRISLKAAKTTLAWLTIGAVSGTTLLATVH